MLATASDDSTARIFSIADKSMREDATALWPQYLSFFGELALQQLKEGRTDFLSMSTPVVILQSNFLD